MKTDKAHRYLVVFAFFAFLSAIVALLVYRVQSATQQDFEILERRITELSDRLDRHSTQWADQCPDQPPKLAELEAQDHLRLRLQAVEDDLALLWQTAQREGISLTDENDHQPEDGEPLGTQQLAGRPAANRILAGRFQSESEVSAWGKTSEEGITRAFNASSYFGATGGEIEGECRSSMCQLVWYLPDLDRMSAHDRELLLLFGKSELAALAVQAASRVGRLESEWILDDGAPRLSLFFAQPE